MVDPVDCETTRTADNAVAAESKQALSPGLDRLQRVARQGDLSGTVT
jgi:hypothetical protein